MRGARQETLALQYLEARGLHALERNFRSRFGEIDLLMEDGETLVVVEVRARSRSDFGSAIESVGARKIARIVRTTRALLATRPALARRPVRFDVIAVDGADNIEWLQSAFDTETWG